MRCDDLKKYTGSDKRNVLVRFDLSSIDDIEDRSKTGGTSRGSCPIEEFADGSLRGPSPVASPSKADGSTMARKRRKGRKWTEPSSDCPVAVLSSLVSGAVAATAPATLAVPRGQPVTGATTPTSAETAPSHGPADNQAVQATPYPAGTQHQQTPQTPPEKQTPTRHSSTACWSSCRARGAP